MEILKTIDSSWLVLAGFVVVVLCLFVYNIIERFYEHRETMKTIECGVTKEDLSG